MSVVAESTGISLNPGRAFWRLEGARRLRNHLACLTADQVKEVDDLLEDGCVDDAFTSYAQYLRVKQAAVRQQRGDGITPTIPMVDIANRRIHHVSSTGNTVNEVRWDARSSEWQFLTRRTAGDEVAADLAELAEQVDEDPRRLGGVFRQVREMIDHNMIDATYE